MQIHRYSKNENFVFVVEFFKPCFLNIFTELTANAKVIFIGKFFKGFFKKTNNFFIYHYVSCILDAKTNIRFRIWDFFGM